MTMKQALYFGVAAVAMAAVWAGCSTGERGGDPQAASAAVRIDGNDIGGVVTGPKGPEAGVWVSGITYRPWSSVTLAR